MKHGIAVVGVAAEAVGVAAARKASATTRYVVYSLSTQTAVLIPLNPRLIFTAR